jgi:hypothetical protein
MLALVPASVQVGALSSLHAMPSVWVVLVPYGAAHNATQAACAPTRGFTGDWRPEHCRCRLFREYFAPLKARKPPRRLGRGGIEPFWIALFDDAVRSVARRAL